MYSASEALRMAALAGVDLCEHTTDEHVMISKFTYPQITATRNKFYNHCRINYVAEPVKLDQKFVPEDSFDLE